MKEKIAAATLTYDAKDDLTEELTDTDSVTDARRPLEPLPRRPSAKKAVLEEERLLGSIAAREEQTRAFQSKILDMLAPSKATERTRYADWAKEVMVSLHPSLWLKFQRECTNLLYTYLEKTEELLNPVSQRLPPEQPLYSAQQQTQYPFNPSSGASSTSAMWLPSIQPWPAAVQHNIPLWGSHNSALIQGQGTELQQMRPVVQGPISTNVHTSIRPTMTSTTQSCSPALSLSKIIRETITMPNDPLESADVSEDQ